MMAAGEISVKLMMETSDLARLVEFSEARAYASLMQAAPPAFLLEHGLRSVSIGSAVAVVAESVTNTLNMNRVIGLGVAEPATESMLDEITMLYAPRQLSFGIEVGPCALPRDVLTWLRKRRIRRAMPTAIHYRVAEPIDVAHKAISVIRADGSEREIVADICCAVFRMPNVAHTLLAGTANLPGWRQWLVYREGRAVAAALSFIRGGVAWLGWDATLPEFRGHGAQSALISHRVNDAVRAGCRYVTTETAPNTADNADPSYRNYARLGFALAYERVTYIGVGADLSRQNE